jgi:putative hemolysin
MLAAAVDQPVDEVFQLLASSPYSRLPLYEGSVDHIVGIVHVKDLLALAFWQRQAPDSPDPARNLRDVMHPVLFVPDSIQIEEVIAQMQKVRQNIAIVVDEYGGTAGLLAFEDLMEEIIGDFQDEFDAEFPPLRLTTKNQLIVRGELHLDVINNLLGTHFYSEDVETIGGLVANQLGKIPTVGERIEIDEVRIRVEKMDQQRVAEVNFSLTPAQLDRLAEMTNE